MTRASFAPNALIELGASVDFCVRDQCDQLGSDNRIAVNSVNNVDGGGFCVQPFTQRAARGAASAFVTVRLQACPAS